MWHGSVQSSGSLHGNPPVTKITRDHVRTFREALQDIPRSRPGKLATAILLEPLECTHPDAQTITSRTTEQAGGIQTIVNWAGDNRMIPDHLWTDPFSNMRVDEDDPEGGSFNPDELRRRLHRPYSPRVSARRVDKVMLRSGRRC
jgi:hypothetical protein